MFIVNFYSSVFSYSNNSTCNLHTVVRKMVSLTEAGLYKSHVISVNCVDKYLRRKLLVGIIHV